MHHYASLCICVPDISRLCAILKKILQISANLMLERLKFTEENSAHGTPGKLRKTDLGLELDHAQLAKLQIHFRERRGDSLRDDLPDHRGELLGPYMHIFHSRNSICTRRSVRESHYHFLSLLGSKKSGLLIIDHRSHISDITFRACLMPNLNVIKK